MRNVHGDYSHGRHATKAQVAREKAAESRSKVRYHESVVVTSKLLREIHTYNIHHFIYGYLTTTAFMFNL